MQLIIFYALFLSPVTDIHSVLYITVKDDEKSRCEFLGRVAIPLMKVCLDSCFLRGKGSQQSDCCFGLKTVAKFVVRIK